METSIVDALKAFVLGSSGSSLSETQSELEKRWSDQTQANQLHWNGEQTRYDMERQGNQARAAMEQETQRSIVNDNAKRLVSLAADQAGHLKELGQKMDQQAGV
ncbi:hypothetical protein DUT91_24200 [Phyllobacterium salinisoli]|uniref:Uncharacterized protein n=1 Tax=Phyllobacterium salinisoli TaxID=1899321 RepID=A0A368K0C9_9HYPH|nr:hypothetical protein [Phyllobacterium salinisoli]RCS21420.1 hypothetical protein DUT91_24200 [Phyllobacterium salinisoli]